MSTVDERPIGEIGEKFDPLNPHTALEYYTRARAEQPVFYNPRLNVWVVTKYDDINEIERLVGTQKYTAKGALNLVKPPCPAALDIILNAGIKVDNTIVDEDPPEHTVKRKVLREYLGEEVVNRFEPQIRDLVNEKLDSLVKKGSCDLVADYVFEIPAWVIFQLMAVPAEDMERVREYAKGNGKFGFGIPTDEEQVEDAKGIAKYWEYAKAHVDELVENPGDDIMSHYIRRLQEEDPSLYDIQDAYTVMLQLLFAGHETTTNTSGNAFRHLLENRDQWEMICNDPSLIPHAIDEIMRFATPVPHWRRTTTEDVEIRGVKIPAGETVMIALHSANHDEDVFENPGKLDICRKNARHHLAFGKGRHRCLGEALARLELRVILEELAKRLPHIELVEGQPWVYGENISHRGVEHCLVTWDPSRNPIPADRP
ncbi:cytochrome P450 [Pseudonocardia sp. RS010]|uniref:cytochrome P450 n=1 Tax=Pseudonocardia sp. RS010 TaxID=3385979 RepID=UPI0039A09434